MNRFRARSLQATAFQNGTETTERGLPSGKTRLVSQSWIGCQGRQGSCDQYLEGVKDVEDCVMFDVFIGCGRFEVGLGTGI